MGLKSTLLQNVPQTENRDFSFIYLIMDGMNRYLEH